MYNTEAMVRSTSSFDTVSILVHDGESAVAQYGDKVCKAQYDRGIHGFVVDDVSDEDVVIES